MINSLLDAWFAEGCPLDQYCHYTQWGIYFTKDDIAEMQKFQTLMTPLATLFSRLNADHESTLHLVYPSLKVTLL